MEPGPKNPSPWGQAGLALMIPSLMVAGPLAGFLIAWLIGRWTGWQSRWITVGLVLLGMVAGVRETIKVIRRIK
jgi:F0F1-type ATP synthase assembly protein I